MSSLGYKHTPEARRRIGAASRGKKCLPGCECWKHSEETRQRQSEAAKGKSGRCPRCAAGDACSQHPTGNKCVPGCKCGRHSVSEETRQKLSENRRSRTPEQEERRRAAQREKIAGNKYAAGTVFTLAERQRRSDLSKKMWSEGVFEGESRPFWGRSAGVHAGVSMRCLNSEGVFAGDLDRAGIAWQYEPKRFKLSWCTYTPDFYLPEFDIWVEVKGYPKQTGKWADKVDAFRRETGKTLILVFQNELSARKYGGE